ncbi:MAG: hypothetical protein M3256_07780 [Actinomycetota bacterium]|nr:hypothetical protein [Actinomycetota bacterium]
MLAPTTAAATAGGDGDRLGLAPPGVVVGPVSVVVGPVSVVVGPVSVVVGPVSRIPRRWVQ